MAMSDRGQSEACPPSNIARVERSWAWRRRAFAHPAHLLLRGPAAPEQSSQENDLCSIGNVARHACKHTPVVSPQTPAFFTWVLRTFRATCPQARPATFHFLVCCREQHSSRVLQFVPMQNWSEQTGHPRRQAGKRTPSNDSSSILPFRLNRALISDEAYHTALRRSASRCKCVRAGCIPDTLQPISPSPAQGVRTAPLLTTGACVDT
jgi:hypothetical protein